MVRPRQLEPEQVEEAGDDVEVAGDVQVQSVVGRQEQGQARQRRRLVRRREHVVLDRAVQQQVRQPAGEKDDAGLGVAPPRSGR